MKSKPFLFLTLLLGALLTLESCARNTGNDVWEDAQSAGRHVQRGVNALTGRSCDSRLINSRRDFECIDDEEYYPSGDFQDYDYQSDFVPLEDQANGFSAANMQTPPPKETPGEPGSRIPGIQAFRDTSTIPQLAGIFQVIYFEYNNSQVKGEQNLQRIHAIADYMRSHPNLSLFIEGHTDERGAQSYNLALGSKRANTVRNLLISEGINPDHLFTISYGKERPVVMEHHEEGWSKNRRAEFKVYGY